MTRPPFLAAALAGTLAVALPLAGFSQLDPTDSGTGTKLGLAQLNNSGEVGTVTLYARGKSSTLLIINLEDQPAGRAQPAHIHRGHDCATATDLAYSLAPVVNGVSKTIVNASESKLLSGNYVVNVHSSSQNMGRYVSCGELHQ